MRIDSRSVIESYKSDIPGARSKIIGVAIIAFVSLLSVNILILANSRGPVKNVRNTPTNPVAIKP